LWRRHGRRRGRRGRRVRLRLLLRQRGASAQCQRQREHHRARRYISEQRTPNESGAAHHRAAAVARTGSWLSTTDEYTSVRSLLWRSSPEAGNSCVMKTTTICSTGSTQYLVKYAPPHPYSPTEPCRPERPTCSVISKPSPNPSRPFW